MEREFLHEYDFLPWIDIKDLDAEIKTLYYSDYWDGPLTGAILWNGKKYWFEVYRFEDDYNKDRTVVLMDLSEEDWIEEEERQQLWMQCSGNRCYDLPENYEPTKSTDYYYAKYPPGSKERLTGKPVAHLSESLIMDAAKNNAI